MKNESDMKQSSPAAESVRNMPWGIVGLLMAFSFVNYFNRTSMADAGAGKIIPEELQKVSEPFPAKIAYSVPNITSGNADTFVSPAPGLGKPARKPNSAMRPLISEASPARFPRDLEIIGEGFACNPRDDWYLTMLSARVWPWLGRRPSTYSWLDRIPNFTSVLREGFYAQVSSEIRFYAD